MRKQGNSIGITLPAETRIRLGLEVGQELKLVGILPPLTPLSFLKSDRLEG
ncbi:AbrB/MazE/SpoVT family DNA-binding domain-containing protein [Acetobacter malorum]|uniref:AbrB/MazE/SpoVT family DNA-binding domain-containing protein n=1 Tax=Acetobacter malorum TaxID=178901 RepID=UPI001E617022|nr:AbrB/MazE/SpoVT family DNA-binding domain-containing protein [Acetobacter malorum]